MKNDSHTYTFGRELAYNGTVKVFTDDNRTIVFENVRWAKDDPAGAVQVHYLDGEAEITETYNGTVTEADTQSDEPETVERYGHEVDWRSGEIIDRLDDAFEGAGNWKIADHSSLAITGNRHMTIEDTGEYPTLEGKLPSEVFRAVREAGCRVTGVYTGVRGEHTARVWVEER